MWFGSHCFPQREGEKQKPQERKRKPPSHLACASSKLWSVMVIICCKMSPSSCFLPPSPRSLRPHPASAGTGRGGVRHPDPSMGMHQPGGLPVHLQRQRQPLALPLLLGSAPGKHQGFLSFKLSSNPFQDKQRRGKKEDQKKKIPLPL